MKPCVVIPVFNHAERLGPVLEALVAQSLPVVLVDDGSRADAAKEIDVLVAKCAPSVTLIRHAENQGKGGAVMTGLREAARLGFTHALQIDADGQHNAADVPRFLAEAEAHPEALISGRPVFDASVPKGRLIGRYATHLWVWINTLSFDIADAMCGFRVYPLAATVALLDREALGRRMDFDIEVMVRLHWAGVEVRHLPTQVTYPQGGVSHFQPLKDNVRISLLHMRLFFGMLWRWPGWLMGSRRSKQTTHWAAMGERGTMLGLKTLLWVHRLLGRWAVQLLLYPVIFYFFLTSKTAREASLEYLRRMAAAYPQLGLKPSYLTSCRHFLAMGSAMIDKVLTMAGGITLQDVDVHQRHLMTDVIASGKGGIVLTAHLGNLEAMQALADQNAKLTLNILTYTQHAENFQRLISEVKRPSKVRLMQVGELGPDTALELSARVARGEWLVIAGDRVPVSSPRTVNVEFLGKTAPFPIGPHLLGGLLGCPVILVMCVKLNGRYNIFYESFADPLKWTRSTRDEVIRQSAQAFAQRLEYHCAQAPLQWFNFYPFWRTS